MKCTISVLSWDILQYLGGLNRLEFESKGLIKHECYLISGLVYPIVIKYE